MANVFRDVHTHQLPGHCESLSVTGGSHWLRNYRYQTGARTVLGIPVYTVCSPQAAQKPIFESSLFLFSVTINFNAIRNVLIFLKLFWVTIHKAILFELRSAVIDVPLLPESGPVRRIHNKNRPRSLVNPNIFYHARIWTFFRWAALCHIELLLYLVVLMKASNFSMCFIDLVKQTSKLLPSLGRAEANQLKNFQWISVKKIDGKTSKTNFKEHSLFFCGFFSIKGKLFFSNPDFNWKPQCNQTVYKRDGLIER